MPRTSRPSWRQTRSGRLAVVAVALSAVAVGVQPVLAPAASAATVVPKPTHTLPTRLDVTPTYQEQRSCDPAAKPGVEAYARMVLTTYKQGHSGGIVRGCGLGSTSEHKEGRAFDWMLSVNKPAEKAAGDALTKWLTGKDSHGVVGGNARRLGVMYVIWNRHIWSTYRIGDGWRPYSGASAHTDHVHTSFTWDGAWRRTSWWDGSATTSDDRGTCRVYAGQPAPVYTVRHASACTSHLLAAPRSAYGIVWPGQTTSSVKVAQKKLGVTADGVFGSQTRSKLFSWQKGAKVPVTGVLDKPTWAKLVSTGTSTPPPPTAKPNPKPDPASRSRDLSSDGWTDLVLRVASSGELRLYHGNGTYFSAPSRVGTGWNAMWTVSATGDFTGDGRADIVAVERSSGILYVYPGLGNGRVGARVRMGTGWNALTKVTGVGDLSGDGTADLVGVSNDGRLMLYAGTGQARLTPGVAIATGWNKFDQIVGVGDVDADGHVDIMGRVRSTGRLAFYHGDGKGRLSATPSMTGGGWNTMGLLASAGDLTGDGRPDLVAVEKATGILWRYESKGATLGGRAAIGKGWNVANDLG